MFFIVGRGRSGSTLLARMLDAHPRIVVAEEALFVMSLAPRYARGAWSERRILKMSRDIWREERMRRWGLDRHALEQRLIGLAPYATFSRLCAEVYAASAEARGRGVAVLLGDKNPHYALFVPELAALFPEARFLHLLRDYRDNVLSYRGVAFDISSVGGLAYRWRRYNETILRSELAEPSRFLRVHFEELVAAPATQLARICEFLGVDYASEMLRSHEAPRRAELPWHVNVAGPPDPNLTQKWKSAMSARQLAYADAVCQPLAAQLGYAATGAVSAARRLTAMPGVAWGWCVTAAERLLFRLPLGWRARVIRCYRRSTGNAIP